jgi:phage protein D
VQVDIDGPTHPVLVQFNQSDLAFLRERAVACDAELWIDNRTLYVQSRTRRDMGKVELTWGKDLQEFSVLADLAHQRSSVRVTGWNVGNKDAMQEDAAESVISSELMGGRSGSSVLAAALSTRKEQVVTATPMTQQEARKLAETRYRARARSFVSGYGVSEGNIKLRVGCSVALNGLGPLFDGSYYVTVARHTFSLQDGYLTAFEVERAGLGG